MTGAAPQAPGISVGRVIIIALVAALIGAGVGGFVVYRVVETDDPDPHIPDAIAIDGTRYLALGDSYAAGEGLPRFYDRAPGDQPKDNCHRSEHGFATLLPLDDSVTVENRACSGAVIANLLDRVQVRNGLENTYGLQLQVGEDLSDVGLITLSIGGNDANFSQVLEFCFLKSNCEERIYRDTGLTLQEWAAQEVPQILARAQQVYRYLQANAPDSARVIVLGYPHLFPAGSPSGSPVCTVISNVYDAGERQFVRRSAAALNQGLQDAAMAAGLEFIDINFALGGHEECGPLDDWVNPFNPEAQGQSSFHPNRDGQKAYAALISCYLNLVPDPASSAAEAMSTGAADYEQLLGCMLGATEDDTSG